MKGLIKSLNKQVLTYSLFICIGLGAGCGMTGNDGHDFGIACYNASPTNLATIESCVKNKCTTSHGAGSFASKACCQDACNAAQGKPGFTDQNHTDCLGESANC